MLTRRRAFSIIGAASANSLVDANGEGSTRMPHPRDSAAIEAAIVVDSAASLPDGFRDAPNAFIAPMLLHVGGDSYRDGVDLTPAAFYEMQRRIPVATTSAPTPASYLVAFRQALEVAGAALCVTVGGAFSASRDSAETARARLLSSQPNADIRILDSLTAAGAQGLIAWEALRAAKSGASIDAVSAAAARVRERVRLLAYVDTLYYLAKGGRVPRIAHAAASLLKLKPVFELSGGEVRGVAKPRTARRATAKLVELVKARAGSRPIHACVMHAAAEERARELASALKREMRCAELFVAEFTPAMGAHTGAGVVGVAYWREP